MKLPTQPVRNARAGFILAAFLFFSIKNVFCEQITLNVNGYGEYESTTIPLEFEWQESWFTQKSPHDYNHNIARVAAALSAISYIDCSPKENLMTQTYSRLGVVQEDIEYFYDIDYNDEEYGFNQSAFSFAIKKIADNTNLIFVVIRGTPVGEDEWLSNLNINDGRDNSAVYHEGFFRAVDQLQKRFDQFVSSRGIDLNNTVLFITGHSRGAAEANLFSALLADNKIIDTQKIFTYAFATPNVTVRQDANNERYNFIWNIVNGEDIVPTLPPTNDKWNFTKFGRTRVIINSWNCNDLKTYSNVYVQKMETLYKQFLGREYHPFNTGTFIGTKFSDTITTINKDTNKFYKGFFPLHKKTTNLIHGVFEEEQGKSSNSSSLERILESVKRHADTKTKLLIQYSINAFIDMHAMQEYFSWLYSLEEDEVFCQKESTIVRLNGNFNGAVVDETGEIYARIYDGVLRLRETKAPLAAWQIPIGNFGIVSIGFPAKKNYSLLIYKDSILPTPIKVEIERYGSDGLHLGTISKKMIGAHSGIVYNFKTGESTLMQENGSAPVYKKLKKDDAKLAIKDGRLKNTDISRMNFEIHFDTDGFAEFGMTSGWQKIYIAALIGADLSDIGSRQLFSMGLGTQHAFCGPLMISGEGFFKFVRYSTNTDNNLFAMIPSVRVMFSVRPAKRFQVFTATEFNIYIEDFNSNAFDNGYRKNRLPPIGDRKFRLYPAIQFGLKF